MKKKLLVLPCIAAVAIATFVGTKDLWVNASEQNVLLENNVDALAQGEGTTYRYPNKEGKAAFCTMYIYMKGDVVVSKGTEEIPQYEGKVEYTKTTIRGLQDKCPNRGEGCNPYSCQEVPF